MHYPFSVQNPLQKKKEVLQKQFLFFPRSLKLRPSSSWVLWLHVITTSLIYRMQHTLTKELLISSHAGTDKEFLAHSISSHLEELMQSKLHDSKSMVGAFEDLIKAVNGQSVN